MEKEAKLQVSTICIDLFQEQFNELVDETAKYTYKIKKLQSKVKANVDYIAYLKAEIEKEEARLASTNPEAKQKSTQVYLDVTDEVQKVREDQEARKMLMSYKFP